MFRRIVTSILLSLLIQACGQQTNNASIEHQSSARVPQNWLSAQHAKLRKQQISNVSYQLDFDITGAKQFSGASTMTFDSKPPVAPLTIDFSQGRVAEVQVNGQVINIDYNDYFITVAKKWLVSGKNVIRVKYSHDYSQNGSGFYRYEDHSDNTSYLYTHFEPYHANKLFPGFDQPNLRATYTLNVIAPAHWHVITSVRESRVVKQGEFRHWRFPPSASFSSYIFPLHAGPYHMWQERFEDIPLRLFARQSLAKHVDARFLFDISKKGLAFYHDYFDLRYPFTKYDQLIVPDFNIGGMENVAAVTYRERIIKRGTPTREDNEKTANLLLHEMSHMWFGNLVTIDWWSNLWLKESFATYMSHLALEKTALSQNAWTLFYRSSKQDAYLADEKVTTHPIQMPVADTKSGDASFDDITYDKGASVLNQLAHYLGEKTFRDGVRAYLKKYAWQAARLPDFINTLSRVADQDLTQWTQDWLYGPGANRIQVAFECADHQLNQLKVIQSFPKQYPLLRQHSLQIGLYSLDENKIGTIAQLPITVSGASTSVEVPAGQPCPDLIYPNVGDWGYVKVLPDAKTLDNIPQAIPLIDDSLLRAMFYQSLWDQVEEQQWPLTRYLDLVTTTIATEQDIKILYLVLDHIEKSIQYLNRFSDAVYPHKNRYLLHLEAFLWQTLALQTPGSDQQQIWFDSMVGASQSAAGLARLVRLLQGSERITGLLFDQDKRWLVLQQLSAFAHIDTRQLMAAEARNDVSYQGELAAIAAHASLPDTAAKHYWLGQFEKTTGQLTAEKQKVAMKRLFPAHQSQLAVPFADRIIADLVSFDIGRDQKLIKVMVKSMLPTSCTKNSVLRLQQAIDDHPGLGLTALKGLKEAHQADQRCVAISKVR